MEDYNSKKEKLYNIYKIWADEVKNSFPEFLTNKYSNPYYTSVPDDWYDNKNRVLVIGEEGFGSSKDENERFDDIDKIQNANNEYVIFNLNKSSGYNKSPFWNRIRRINALSKMSIAWGNSDKIHVLSDDDCSLSEEDRKKLHSVSCNILQEEINILEPSIVIFFGWYYTSILYDMKQCYDEITSNYEKNKNCPFVIFKNDIPYVFSNHPRWGQMHKGYEDMVIELIKKYV